MEHPHSHVPIPSYDEAISSHTFRGPEEISDDAERQAFLSSDSTYRPPTVESSRSSDDSDRDLRLPEVARDGEDERRRVEELDYLDPSAVDPSQSQPRLYHRARSRSKFSQHLSNLGATLSSIRLPSFRSLYAPISTGTAPETAPLTSPPPSRLTWLTRTVQRFPTISDRWRMSASTAARLFGLASIAILIYTLFVLDVFPNNRYLATQSNPEAVRVYVQDCVDAERIEQYLKHITSYDHVAGTEGDLYMAEWMKERWMEEGNLDDIALLSYFVYLNYPTPDGRSVSIVLPEDKSWTATLEENIVDPNKKQTLAWHGHSFSGHVKGHLVYANGGSENDFLWLQQHGVDLNNSIALMRSYGTQADRSLKVKAAEKAGCVGALIYSDPADDGSVKGAVWPDGPWRPDDSLQRGSVAMSSFILGDPLTPGIGSRKDAPRMPKKGNPALNQIPSLPLAWRDAKVLIKSLNGQGVRVPDDWIGGDKAFPRKWYSGASGKGVPVVELKNMNDENDKQEIWNLHGLIQGIEQPEKKIIIGSHRDAWCFGSVDPGSGSAVLMEMVHIFGQLRELGWRPLRTIEFVSWDAEEYNLVGSTEYVEDNIHYLRDHAIAYLNVDVGVYGPNPSFRAAGSPVWQRPLQHVLDRITAPGDNITLGQIWKDGSNFLKGLGAGSDYAAFQAIAGTSAIDFGFEGARNGFPYHSCYESFDWMKKLGDPDFAWHKTLAQVWALLILEVADRPILPFDLSIYSNTIGESFIKNLHQEVLRTGSDLNLSELEAAVRDLTETAHHLHVFEDAWVADVLRKGKMENSNIARQRLLHNNKLAAFETDLLDLPSSPADPDVHGIPGREQFKHILFGPQTSDGYEVTYFPAVVDALHRGNSSEAQFWVDRAAAVLSKATANLRA